MNKYPSPIVLMLYGVACMILGAMLFDYGSRVDRSVLPSSELGSVGALSTGPAHKSFSSPSSVVAVSNQSTATIISTMDLQRELNRLDPKLKLKVDGVYGPRTQAAHEAAVGDQYAKELMQEIRTDSKAGRNGINDRTGPSGYIWKIANGTTY